MKRCLKRRNGLTLFEILCICVVMALVAGFFLTGRESSLKKTSQRATTTTIDDKGEFVRSTWGSASFSTHMEEVKTNGVVSSETANTNEGWDVETKVRVTFK